MGVVHHVLEIKNYLSEAVSGQEILIAASTQLHCWSEIYVVMSLFGLQNTHLHKTDFSDIHVSCLKWSKAGTSEAKLFSSLEAKLFSSSETWTSLRCEIVEQSYPVDPWIMVGKLQHLSSSLDVSSYFWEYKLFWLNYHDASDKYIYCSGAFMY